MYFPSGLEKGGRNFFFSETHSQRVQQVLKALDRAYKNFFAKRDEFLRFKKEGVHDAFHSPQGFKLNEGNSRLFLPKIGWVRYRKSGNTEGTPKQVIVSGDLAAVEQGLGLKGLARLQNKKLYKNPDMVSNAAEELKKLTQWQ